MQKLLALVAALAMVVTFTMTAAAAEWNFYGNARVSTFVDDSSGDTEFALALQGNSRIGANVKVSDELSGRFEYGSGPNLRLLYGAWNFGGGTLLVGQDYTPIDSGTSSQVYDVDNGLCNYGAMDGGRKAQLKLIFGGFQIAFVESTDTDLPLLAAAYTANFDAATIKFAGAFNKADVGDNGWALGVEVNTTFDAIFINGNIYFGDNAEQVLVSGSAGEDNLGYTIVIGSKISEALTIEAGYGNDDSDSTDSNKAYYINATITLAPGVIVVPEIGEVDDGDTTYFGAKWQINF